MEWESDCTSVNPLSRLITAVFGQHPMMVLEQPFSSRCPPRRRRPQLRPVKLRCSLGWSLFSGISAIPSTNRAWFCQSFFKMSPFLTSIEMSPFSFCTSFCFFRLLLLKDFSLACLILFSVEIPKAFQMSHLRLDYSAKPALSWSTSPTSRLKRLNPLRGAPRRVLRTFQNGRNHDRCVAVKILGSCRR